MANIHNNNEISVDDLLSKCQTGDLLLFNTRTHWYDFLIEKFSKSKFSHVGMIVRDISCLDCSNVGICMLEAGYEDFTDVVDNKHIYGVQLSNLKEVLSTYALCNYNSVVKQNAERATGRSGYVYYRALDCARDASFDRITREKISTVYEKPYDLLPQDWIKSAFHIETGNERRMRTFWCSALVAYMYDMYGFINRQTHWTIIQPTQFSYYEGKELTFSTDIKLSPEILVRK